MAPFPIQHFVSQRRNGSYPITHFRSIKCLHLIQPSWDDLRLPSRETSSFLVCLAQPAKSRLLPLGCRQRITRRRETERPPDRPGEAASQLRCGVIITVKPGEIQQTALLSRPQQMHTFLAAVFYYEISSKTNNKKNRVEFRPTVSGRN